MKRRTIFPYVKEAVFIMFVAVFLIFIYGYLKAPYIQMANDLSSEQKEAIAIVADLDAEHKIIYAERISGNKPCLIVWIRNEYDIENSGVYVNGLDKTENVHKYDPLSRVFVKGNLYKKDGYAATIYMYKNYFGNFVRYQICFLSSEHLKPVDYIFSGLKKYKAGNVDEYDQWRLKIDK